MTIEELSFKSILHGNVSLSKISFKNFILAYINMLDCLLYQHIEDLKKFNEGIILLILKEDTSEGKNTYK